MFKMLTRWLLQRNLPDSMGNPTLAKKYWQEVKNESAGRQLPAAKLASQNLWELNRGRYLFNIGLARCRCNSNRIWPRGRITDTEKQSEQLRRSKS